MSTDTLTDEQTTEFLDSVRGAIDGLEESASVNRAFGDPIAAEGKTIIPVARVAYGFGSGFGSGSEGGDPDADEESGSGGGGGGGMAVSPLGVLEVTDSESHFVSFRNWRRTALAVGAGLAVGLLLGRR